MNDIDPRDQEAYDRYRTRFEILYFETYGRNTDADVRDLFLEGCGDEEALKRLNGTEST